MNSCDGNVNILMLAFTYCLYVFWLSYDDTLVVPIIENTPEEKDLKEHMARAMDMYPDSCAVLVRRHGVYVWGETWEKAKTMWAIRN